MPICCHPTRREVLGWAALVSASPLLTALADPERAYAAGGNAVPMNLELVTLTETTAVLTWYTGDPSRPDGLGRPSPVPSDTEVLLGTSPTRLRQVHHRKDHTPYHHAEIRGLEPGRRYYYLARSGGLVATPAPSFGGNVIGTSGVDVSSSGPFTLRTPQPPPGRFLFAIALCNDLHLGETVSGLSTSVGGIPATPGFRQEPGLPPYTQVMASGLARHTRAHGAHLLIAGGDLTTGGAPTDIADARRYLDRFGAYRDDYLVVRGNHDRPENDAASAQCSVVPHHGDYHDCFSDEFFPGTEPTWFESQFHGLRILGLDTYDKIGSGGDNGELSPAQFDFVTSTLRHDRDRPTLVIGHHPVTVEATATTVPPVTFDMKQSQARRLERLYASAPGVFLHHSGHTHRNKRTQATGAPGVVFQEVAAVKEYPGGYHLLRVFSGGYALNFYKLSSPLALEWSERSRQEYYGLYPYYTAGTLSDRNHVVARDLSGLSARGASHRPSGVPSAPEPGRNLATTGSDPALSAVGSVTLVAAAAARHWLRRKETR